MWVGGGRSWRGEQQLGEWRSPRVLGCSNVRTVRPFHSPVFLGGKQRRRPYGVRQATTPPPGLTPSWIHPMFGPGGQRGAGWGWHSLVAASQVRAPSRRRPALCSLHMALAAATTSLPAWQPPTPTAVHRQLLPTAARRTAPGPAHAPAGQHSPTVGYIHTYISRCALPCPVRPEAAAGCLGSRAPSITPARGFEPAFVVQRTTDASGFGDAEAAAGSRDAGNADWRRAAGKRSSCCRRGPRRQGRHWP